MSTTTDQKPPAARLDWSLYVNCTNCDESFDLVDQDGDNDNSLAKKIFTNEWDKVKGHEVTCPHCSHEFALGGVEY